MSLIVAIFTFGIHQYLLSTALAEMCYCSDKVNDLSPTLSVCRTLVYKDAKGAVTF